MASPQTGIFALGTASHAYLEFDLIGSADPSAVVARVAALREPRTTVGGVNLVAGFRPELWAAIAPDAAPEGVTGFNAPVTGVDGCILPATQHDVVVWLTGAGYDVVFDLSRAVTTELAGSVTLAYEMVGWPYHHDLDLTGFMDGTENPTLVEATSEVAHPVGLPRRGRRDPAAPAMGARCRSLGRPVGPATGGRHRAAQGRQRGAGSEAGELPRRPNGSGHVRPDLPPQHRLRLARPPRNDLRRLQRDATDAGHDAREHGRPRQRAA